MLAVMTGAEALSGSRQERRLDVLGGVSLHLEQVLPARPRAHLVMVHGYAAHVGLYRHIAGAFAADGLAVTGFDCRGHGRSTGRRGHAARFEHYLDDLDRVVDLARGSAPELPLYLLGHSHGATIVLDAVLARRQRPDRMVLAAPWLQLAMKVPGWKRRLGAIAATLWPTLSLPNGIRGEDISRNAEVVANFWQDPLAHHVATARWFAEATAAQRRILATAAQLDVPALVLLAGDDRIVVNDASSALAAQAPRFIRLHRFDGLFHELFLEPEWPEVVSEILRFLAPQPGPHDHRVGSP
jgi:alpha-beta hydrolase superfamily lysophospholipase